jgi:hypothetical protein
VASRLDASSVKCGPWQKQYSKTLYQESIRDAGPQLSFSVVILSTAWIRAARSISLVPAYSQLDHDRVHQSLVIGVSELHQLGMRAGVERDLLVIGQGFRDIDLHAV